MIRIRKGWDITETFDGAMRRMEDHGGLEMDAPQREAFPKQGFARGAQRNRGDNVEIRRLVGRSLSHFQRHHARTKVASPNGSSLAATRQPSR